MKKAQSAVIGVAVAMLLALLWKVDARAVWTHASQVGWGLTLIIAQEIGAHVFNALGWRFAFYPRAAGAYSFLKLIHLRVSGDGVNYLTPSATIAGEFMRANWLGSEAGLEDRYSSVAVAKLTQGLGQALFVIVGLALLADGRIPLKHAGAVRALAAAVGAGLIALALFAGWRARRPLSAISAGAAGETGTEAPHPSSLGWRSALKAVPAQCLEFFRDHPGRLAASTCCFSLGFAWGAFEAYWICVFLGVPVSIKTAILIEVLSNMIDGMLFMVPAKIGTQEAGKTAIFTALALPPSAGFAFGVIRHIRELTWAAGGLALSPGASAATASSTR